MHASRGIFLCLFQLGGLRQDDRCSFHDAKIVEGRSRSRAYEAHAFSEIGYILSLLLSSFHF